MPKTSSIKALNYEQFAPILTAAFQEQMQISYNDSLKQKQTLDSLRYTLDSLRPKCISKYSKLPEYSFATTKPRTVITELLTLLKMFRMFPCQAIDACLLYQNSPNPFVSGTKIAYYLPENTQGAEMLFFDNYGNKIKEVQLSQTGNGTLNVTPEKLSAGIYSYSLVVNGKVIDTKRMLLQK